MWADSRRILLEIAALAAEHMRARLVHIRRRCIPCELQKFMSRTHLALAVHFVFDRLFFKFRFEHRLGYGLTFAFALMAGRFMGRYTLSRRCGEIASATLESATFVVAMMLHVPLHIPAWQMSNQLPVDLGPIWGMGKWEHLPFVYCFEVTEFANNKVHCVVASVALKSITNVMRVIALIATVYFDGFVFAANVFDHR